MHKRMNLLWILLFGLLIQACITNEKTNKPFIGFDENGKEQLYHISSKTNSTRRDAEILNPTIIPLGKGQSKDGTFSAYTSIFRALKKKN